MNEKTANLVVLVAAVVGFLFASFSTSDFMEHLDRQVHSIHCSFVPGLDSEDASGKSGCHVTMMSPYSSVLRTKIWGGIPISLPGMSVFAFIAFWAAYIWLNRKQNDKRATGFLWAATAVPLLTSIVMGYLALVKLDAACKLCIGIYAASAVTFIAAWLLHRSANLPHSPTAPSATHQESHTAGGLSGAMGVVLGIGFVALPLLAYAAITPDYSKYVGSCGALEKPKDVYGVMVPMGSGFGGAPAIEVLDPLCPACKAFEERLHASELDQKIARSVVLFPLDNTCNWMVNSAVHPGACAVSEAVLCSEGRAVSVIQWAFENQTAIREAASKNPKAAEQLVRTQFPELATCLGSAGVKAKLNRSLRWAVQNNLSILTPQLFVDGVKLCDEDTDLGMDYALSRLIEHRSATGRGAP